MAVDRYVIQLHGEDSVKIEYDLTEMNAALLVDLARKINHEADQYAAAPSISIFKKIKKMVETDILQDMLDG